MGGTGTKSYTGRNTDNPRPLVLVREFVKVTRTQDAEKAAHKALQKWHVKMGGGTEWYRVPKKELKDFYMTFDNAIKKYLY